MNKYRLLPVILNLFILYHLSSFYISAQKQENLDVGEFSKIEVIGRMDIDLVSSNEQKLELYYEGIDKDKIRIINENNSLKIKIISTLKYKDIRVQIRIYYNVLEKIGAYSSANISSDETLVFDNIEFETESGGEIALNLFADTIYSKCSTGGMLTLKGNTKSHNTKISSGSTLSAYDLECNTYSIVVNTKGTAKIFAKDEITGKANSGGDITYKGNPQKKSVEVTMGGSIEQGNF